MNNENMNSAQMISDMKQTLQYHTKMWMLRQLEDGYELRFNKKDTWLNACREHSTRPVESMQTKVTVSGFDNIEDLKKALHNEDLNNAFANSSHPITTTWK